MKAKKVLALFLALIMALSCMSVAVFAEEVPALTYTQTATEIINGTTGLTKIGEITGFTGFQSGTISTTIDVVKDKSDSDSAETAVHTTFGLEEATKNTFYVSLDTAAANGNYYVRLKSTQGETVVYTYVPFTVCSAVLDIDDSDTSYPSSATVAQLYDATVTANNTDVTKVQVSWTLEKISVSVTSSKIWNTETLTWDDDKNGTNSATASDPTATFDFVNLSSTAVYAQVTFEKDAGIKTEPTKTFTDNTETAGEGDGIVKLGTKATSTQTDNTGTIKLELTVTDSDFASLTEKKTDAKYGTYTVEIYAKAKGAFYNNAGKKVEEITLTQSRQDATGVKALFNAYNEANSEDPAVKILLPEGVTSIGFEAFKECDSLKSITLPDTVTLIGKSSFESCKSLESINIPNGVTSIGDYAFRESGLTSIVFPDSVTSIGKYVFEECGSLTAVKLGSGLRTIDEGAFDRCTSLESIVIPGSVTSIGDSAFLGCDNLESVQLGSGVETIGASAFEDCSDIDSIVIPDSVTSIGNKAFYECEKLESVTLGNKVKTIGESAFEGCEYSDFVSIIIPDSVTSIGDYVFKGTNIVTINYKGTQEQWNSITKGTDWDKDMKQSYTISYNYTE